MDEEKSMYVRIMEYLGFRSFYRSLAIIFGIGILFVTFIFILNLLENFT